MSRKVRDKWDLSGISSGEEDDLNTSGENQGSYYSEEERAVRENEEVIFGERSSSRGHETEKEDKTIRHSIDRINRKYLSSNRNGHSDGHSESCVYDKVPFVLPKRDDDSIKDVEYNMETNEIRWLGKETSINEIHNSKSRHVVLVASPTTDLNTYVTAYARKVLEGEVPSLRHIELVLHLRFSEKSKDRLDKLRNVFVESQISKSHVNAEAFYKWIVKHQERVLIITEGWDEMVSAVNEARQSPVEYEGSSTAIHILQKLTKGDLFGKAKLLSVASSLEFNLKGAFRPDRIVMVSDYASSKLMAGMWMHVVCNRIFSRHHNTNEMAVILHKLMHGAYTSTQDGSGFFKLQESKKEWSITKHLHDFTLPLAWKTKPMFKDVALKGIRFKQKPLQHMLCALYLVQLPLGQFYEIIDNDFGNGGLLQTKNFVYGVLLDSRLRKLLHLILPDIEDINLRISALLGHLARRMRGMDMRLIKLLSDCGDGVVGLIQHHIRMFIMKAYVGKEDMAYIARMLSSCSKLHRVQFTNCNFSQRQLEVWIDSTKEKKIPVEIMDFSFNPGVASTALGHLVARYDVSELVLHECEITSDQLYQLANGLRRVSQNLRVIDLRWNILQDDHVSPLIKIMRFLSGVLFLSCRYRRWDVHPDIRNELENAVFRKPLNKQNIHIAWSN